MGPRGKPKPSSRQLNEILVNQFLLYLNKAIFGDFVRDRGDVAVTIAISLNLLLRLPRSNGRLTQNKFLLIRPEEEVLRKFQVKGYVDFGIPQRTKRVNHKTPNNNRGKTIHS